MGSKQSALSAIRASGRCRDVHVITQLAAADRIYVSANRGSSDGRPVTYKIDGSRLVLMLAFCPANVTVTEHERPNQLTFTMHVADESLWRLWLCVFRPLGPPQRDATTIKLTSYNIDDIGSMQSANAAEYVDCTDIATRTHQVTDDADAPVSVTITTTTTTTAGDTTSHTQTYDMQQAMLSALLQSCPGVATTTTTTDPPESRTTTITIDDNPKLFDAWYSVFRPSIAAAMHVKAVVPRPTLMLQFIYHASPPGTVSRRYSLPTTKSASAHRFIFAATPTPTPLPTKRTRGPAKRKAPAAFAKPKAKAKCTPQSRSAAAPQSMAHDASSSPTKAKASAHDAGFQMTFDIDSQLGPAALNSMITEVRKRTLVDASQQPNPKKMRVFVTFRYQ